MALTKVQLEALKNALLASQQPINAATHRDFIQNVIDEMYDAQSRGNLLAGVQSNGTTAGGDTLLLIRSGEMFLVPVSLFGGVGTLAGLSDVVIIDEEGDEVLMYNAVDNVWKNVSLNGRFVTPAQLNAALEGFQLPQGARLISADLILASSTAGTITAEWVDFTGQTESVTNAALAFNAAGLPSAGNFRFDIVQGANNGTVSVKRGIEGSASGVAAPSADADNLILALILWAEDGTGEVGQPGNGNVLQNDFSLIRFGTEVTANSTGLFAKVLETDLSSSGSYSIILAYAETRNAVNFDGSGAQELRVSFTVDTSRVIIAQTVQVVTSQGSSAGEFVLYQLAGNRAAVYHRSNHFWGRIQFRVVFQSSQVPLTDFVNNAPYAGEIGFLARYGSSVELGFNDARYLRKDIADTKTGNLTLNDSLLIPTGGIQAISSSTSANNGGSFRFGEDGVESFRIGRDNFTGGGFGTNQFIRRAYFYDRVDFRNGGLFGTNTAQINTATGRIFHARSGALNESIRRDEQRLFYLSTIATTGAINNQALTAGIFNYRFTAATSITGFTLGEIGLSIIIQNQTGAALTLVNESASSDAANRLKIIGGSNLVIPIDGKATLIYTIGSRWELLSKNF